jgi:hypothetical protein
MTRAKLWLFAMVLALAGCAEEEVERGDRRVADTVEVGNRDPGPACRGVAAVEVQSGKNDVPSADALREYAAARGANYVVVDTFSVYDEPEDATVLTRARLFRCPRLALAEP